MVSLNSSPFSFASTSTLFPLRACTPPFYFALDRPPTSSKLYGRWRWFTRKGTEMNEKKKTKNGIRGEI